MKYHGQTSNNDANATPMSYQRHDRVKIDREPRQFLVLAEPYVTHTYFGYTAALHVYEKKTRREYELLIGAKSLSDQLKRLILNNGNKFSGLEFWLWKEHDSRTARYIIEE